MKTIKNNESGFSAVELVLIIALVVALGVIGWLVYRNQKKTSTAPVTNTTTAVQKPAPATPAVDPTAKWTAYSDATGKFSLRYPTTWVTATSPELCSPGILLLGPTKNTVGRCASEGFGQVHVMSNDGDSRNTNELGSGYVNVEKKDVTVANIVGKKESGVAKGQVTPDSPGLGALEDGTIVVNYIFFTNGKTYVAGYTQNVGDSDVLSDFNLLVTKTLTFSK